MSKVASSLYSWSARILAEDGHLLAILPHRDLVHALAKKGALTDFGRGLFAMPSAEGPRLPVSRRPIAAYRDVYSDEKTP